MSKREIIEKIAKERWVEKIARHFKTFARNDLCQYIYLYLLEKIDEDKIIELYEKKELKQFITGMIYRQVISNHSDYYRTYRSVGLSIENQDEKEIPYQDRLAYRDTIPHQFEDGVDEYINNLPPQEKDMVWLLLQATYDRMEDIQIWCKKYNKTYKQYQEEIRNFKNKLRNDFGAPKKEKHYTSPSDVGKIYHYDKEENLLKIYNTRKECVADLIPKGYCRDAVYKCICGTRKSYKGEKFLSERYGIF